MNNILIIYNPSSGRSRPRSSWADLKKYLSSHESDVTIQSIQDDDAFSALDLSRFSVIIVSGGDGTLRSVVQRLSDAGLNIPIALIPRGSANVVAKSLNLPFSARRTAQLIKKGKTIGVDIARLATGECFVGACALGYLSERITETDQRVKKVMGFGGYILSFMKQTKLPLHQFTFSIDGISHTIQGHSIFVVNACNVFGINSYRVANLSDGAFELVVTTNKSFLSLFGLVFDFYFSKKMPRHFYLKPGKHFVIYNTEKTSIQIDGEPLTRRPMLDITVQKRQQQFIVA